MIFVVMFGQEEWSWSAFAGAVVALAGVVISSFGGKDDGTNSLLGDFYVLLSAISLALCTVITHKLGKKQDPVAQTSLMGFFGLIVFPPFSIKDMLTTHWSAITGTEWLMLIYIGLLGGVFVFAIYFKSVEIFAASSTTIFIFLAIPFGAILNFIFLHEIPTTIQIIGAVIVVAGAGWSIHARERHGGTIHSYGHI